MSKTPKMADYRKEKMITITLSIPAQHRDTLEKFATTPNRTVSEIASLLFIDPTLPKIRKMLAAETTPMENKNAAAPTVPPSPTGTLSRPEANQAPPLPPKQGSPTPTASPLTPIAPTPPDQPTLPPHPSLSTRAVQVRPLSPAMRPATPGLSDPTSQPEEPK